MFLVMLHAAHCTFYAIKAYAYLFSLLKILILRNITLIMRERDIKEQIPRAFANIIKNAGVALNAKTLFFYINFLCTNLKTLMRS